MTPTCPSRHGRGFTLIELMVVCAIVGLIAAAAFPAYTRYVQRGNRAAAQAHLIDLAQKQQQFFADSRTYADSVDDLGITAPKAVSDNYTLTVDLEDGPPPAFTLTATPKAGKAQASDATLSLDSAGEKLPADQW